MLLFRQVLPVCSRIFQFGRSPPPQYFKENSRLLLPKSFEEFFGFIADGGTLPSSDPKGGYSEKIYSGIDALGPELQELFSKD